MVHFQTDTWLESEQAKLSGTDGFEKWQAVCASSMSDIGHMLAVVDAM